MKIASFSCTSSPITARWSKTGGSHAKAGCSRIAERLLSCTGWRKQSPRVPGSPALIGQLRHVLEQVQNAREREVRASTVGEQAYARLQSWLVDDEQWICTYAALGSNLSQIENAYRREEISLRQAWRASWLQGTEEYGTCYGQFHDFRSEAASAVVRAVVVARSELLNVERMTPYIR